MSEELVENIDPIITNSTSDKKSGYFDGKRRPNSKWMLSMVIMLAMGGAGFAVMYVSGLDNTSKGAADGVAITGTSPEQVRVGGKGTENYNQQLAEKSTKDAEEAANTGKSYVPPPVNNALKPIEEPIYKKPEVAPPMTEQQIQELQALKQIIKGTFGGITQGMEMHEQTVINFKEDDDEKKGRASKASYSMENSVNNPQQNTAPAHTKSTALPGGIHSGSILYATNDLRLNSDGKNKIVRATVISGPLRNYTAIGQFDTGTESMMLTFNRLISPEGEEYVVSGYGIDPGIPEANVVSEVDHHYLSRWGGLAAASFLTGFADATRLSGTTSAGLSAGYGAGGISSYGTTVIPTYSLAEKGLIGLGEVGRQVGKELAQGVNRPTTVILEPGIPMGILVVTAGGGK